MGEVELFRVIRWAKDGIFHRVCHFMNFAGFVGKLMKEVGRMQAVIDNSVNTSTADSWLRSYERDGNCWTSCTGSLDWVPNEG